MDNMLRINLFEDTFALTADPLYYNAIISADKNIYAVFKKTAILGRGYLKKSFPSDVVKYRKHYFIEYDLYKHLLLTEIVVHITDNMPNLSQLSFMCEMGAFNRWSDLLKHACVQCMKRQLFILNVRAMGNSDILVTLHSVTGLHGTELHINFEKESSQFS